MILRADGVPTYNFGVVVDDLDMDITHVIRGDDHVNNTPRQINIFRALGATLPNFAHVPMILGADGERLSKRHGAVSVMQYDDDGYLPEALLNYLARLGWSHGDEEVFSREQFVEWFDLEHVSRSPAQFDPEKLLWLNAQYLKRADNARLARIGASAYLVARRLRSCATARRSSKWSRCSRTASTRSSELADAAVYVLPAAAAHATTLRAAALLGRSVAPALRGLRASFGAIAWTARDISAALEERGREARAEDAASSRCRCA